MSHILINNEKVPVIDVEVSEVKAIKHLYFWMFKSEDGKRWCISTQLCRNLEDAEDNAPLYYKERKLMKVDILI